LLCFVGAPRAEVDPSLAAQGWRELTFDGKRPNRFSAGPDGGITVTSEAGDSLLYRPVRADLVRTPCLTWRWRVDQAPPPTDLTRKRADDRAISVWIGFRFDSANVSLGERIKHEAQQVAMGGPVPGQSLIYNWGGAAPTAAFQTNPVVGERGRFRILHAATAPTGVWQTERVNLVEEYRRAFGREPTEPIQIAVSGDADATGTRSVAHIAGLNFTRCE
jgi:hypothetical protein